MEGTRFQNKGRGDFRGSLYHKFTNHLFLHPRDLRALRGSFPVWSQGLKIVRIVFPRSTGAAGGFPHARTI